MLFSCEQSGTMSGLFIPTLWYIEDYRFIEYIFIVSDLQYVVQMQNFFNIIILNFMLMMVMMMVYLPTEIKS